MSQIQKIIPEQRQTKGENTNLRYRTYIKANSEDIPLSKWAITFVM
jgi:hypothetical protein